MYVCYLRNPICLYTKGKKDTKTFSTKWGLVPNPSKSIIVSQTSHPKPTKKPRTLVTEPGCCLIEPELKSDPIIMPRLTSRHGTHPCIWCAAIICALISIAVIVGGIVVFVGYMVIHPRVPIISVADAHLDLLKYDIVGVMQTQLTIVIRAENDNAKAHALFDETEFKLSYEGKLIAILRAPEFEVVKENSQYLRYLVQSYPIPLSPTLMETVDYAVKKDVITFELKGGSKIRWRVGPLGSVKFECNLSCELRFRPSDHTYIPSMCTSAHKN